MSHAIGLFLRSPDNAYQRQLKAVGLREAKRHGLTLKVQSVRFDAAKQIEQIRNAIQSAAENRMIAILVSGVRDAELVPIAHEAAEAGLDWAFLNDATQVDEVRQQYPDRAVFAAAADQTEIGQLQARQIQTLSPSATRVMCITGNIRNIEAHRRLEGLRRGLGEGVEVIEVNADWTSEGARRAIEGWAAGVTSRSDVPSAFAAQNDEMALGVRQALRDIESQRDWPIGKSPIVGCDGAEDLGQRMVRQGRMKATVVMTPATGAAIEWIVRSRNGGSLPPAHLVLPVTSMPALGRLK
jgi:ABC-type sugar transport system substrate-binding protein